MWPLNAIPRLRMYGIQRALETGMWNRYDDLHDLIADMDWFLDRTKSESLKDKARAAKYWASEKLLDRADRHASAVLMDFIPLYGRTETAEAELLKHLQNITGRQYGRMT